MSRITRNFSVAAVKVFMPQESVLAFGGKSQTLGCWTYGYPLPSMPQWFFEVSIERKLHFSVNKHY